jgi:hypothetical protein
MGIQRLEEMVDQILQLVGPVAEGVVDLVEVTEACVLLAAAAVDIPAVA